MERIKEIEKKFLDNIKERPKKKRERASLQKKGKIVNSFEKLGEDYKVVERHEVRDFSDLKQVETVGKLHKGKRRVKIDQKRENIEGQFMYLAMKSNRADKQREDRRAKRRK
jgi:hypothetical protein